MADPDLDDLDRRMNGAMEALRHEFAGLRTGRASIGLLEPIMVDIYGAQMPLNQVGTIGVPEPRLLTVQVWDKSAVAAVDKAIRASGLGLNPAADGQLIRVPIPELTEERRVDLVKVIKTMAEESRIRVRASRKDGMDAAKKMKADNVLTEDQMHDLEKIVQEITDKHIKEIDAKVGDKEKEVMTV